MRHNRFIRRAKSLTSSISHSFDEITQVVEPAEYIRILKHDRKSVKGARFVAPKLGSEGFGKIVIKFK